MSSTRLSLNRCVLAGKAVSDPVTKHVTSRHGDTTLTIFSMRTPNDTYVGSVIIEVQAWSRSAVVAQHVTKGRTVAVDGQLTQYEYLGSDGKKQTRTSLRADRVQLIDEVSAQADQGTN
jgi:single-stranded DNA-binding protein